MKKREPRPPKPKESSYSPQKWPIEYDNATSPKKKIRNKTETIIGKGRGSHTVLKGKAKNPQLLKPATKDPALKWNKKA